jgi:hypothetical protein
MEGRKEEWKEDGMEVRNDGRKEGWKEGRMEERKNKKKRINE